MRVNSGSAGRSKVVLFLCCVLYSIAGHCQTSTGQLTVSLTVQSSINLIFQNNPSVGTNGFCPLTNSGTNNVGLDLGTAAFTPASDSLACVAYSHVTANTYQVSSAFDVVVTKANTSSPNYRLAAEISTAPPVNVVWLVNNTTLTNTAFTQLDASDNYAQAITKTLQVQVRNTVAAQALLETVTFLATAN
ncbi:MAG TPA: hypothetical protein VG488_14030 [Candidatus Angelobacter sp.]|jgi:hypothetical protein|nr:hypothetical protein [Candidatus Angelobacter sp.]